MALDRGKLANIDRRLLAELHDNEEWQPVQIRISAGTWSTWKRYCDVVGMSMGKAIVALIESELASLTDDEIDEGATAIKERMRQLDDRAVALNKREKELERREKRSGTHRPMTEAEIARTADAVEPTEPSWSTAESQHASLEPEIFKGVGRNDPCPCESGLKYKKCHGGVGAR